MTALTVLSTVWVVLALALPALVFLVLPGLAVVLMAWSLVRPVRRPAARPREARQVAAPLVIRHADPRYGRHCAHRRVLH